MRVRTLFNTPGVTFVLRQLSRAFLWINGWTVVGKPSGETKMVMIAAPHTSNWDFIYMITICFVYGMKPNWMGKETLFKGMRGPFMRWMGGIAIDRSKANNVVESVVASYAEREDLMVMITPEGTRGKVDKWKAGFYYIALGAGVPIQPAIMHAPDKVVEIGELFWPTGDADADIAHLRSLYEGKIGIRAEHT